MSNYSDNSYYYASKSSVHAHANIQYRYIKDHRFYNYIKLNFLHVLRFTLFLVGCGERSFNPSDRSFSVQLWKG